jgi:metal transporter CNNM
MQIEIGKVIGIVACLMHSAMFSGVNLGLFGVSRLRLEVLADLNDKNALRILSLRKDAHFLLATILWGNVSANVLIALLTDSIFQGVLAFLVSTFVITLCAEIFPQAYFAKHALRASIVLHPFVRFYQVLLYPLAKPTGMLLDIWIGKEGVIYFREIELIAMLKRYANSHIHDVERLESLGAVNFLKLDDVKIEEEGEIINPTSIISLPINEEGRPIFPKFEDKYDDPFLMKINASREKWVVITDPSHNPVMVLDADQFLREAIYGPGHANVFSFCHRPIIVTGKGKNMGEVINKFKVMAEHAEDDVVDNDIIIYWDEQKRIITGADILGRLFRGIVEREGKKS